jgi:iron complex outermembrane receptor protein
MRQRDPARPVRALTSTCALALLTASAVAQDDAPRATALEEIIVTATRVATNLQQTPMSIFAMSGEALELAGIDTGRDLGIMVPNVVLNPGGGGDRFMSAIIRGLPGVETYVDGVAVYNAGFLQRSFVDIERVEVLRGPQGTLFGRNTNGGAIDIVTRPPAEEFGVEFGAEFGEFERRAMHVAADVPLSDRLRTKWLAASDESEGFMPSLSAPMSLGGRDNLLFRADVLWQPTDRFSLRFNATKDDRENALARVIRMSNPEGLNMVAYNVLAGNPERLAQARAINPAFPAPPFALETDRYTAASHEAGFPGGQVGRWQTREDLRASTWIDHQYGILTLDWQLTNRFSLRSLTSLQEQNNGQFAPIDSSELDTFSELIRDEPQWKTQELQLIGSHFNGRLETLVGFYYQDFTVWSRYSSWPFWEFTIPNTGPNPGTSGPPGVGGRPLWNPAAVGYVQSWGATVGNPALAGFAPATFLTSDRLYFGEDTDRAFFGQFKVGVTDRLDLTLGFRFTSDDAATTEYVPAEAFRPVEPGGVTAGDPYASAALVTQVYRPDSGTASTPKVAMSFEITDDIFLYASYAEGFTSAAAVNSAVGPIVLDPEIVHTEEIGLRSDWFDHRLRLNATLFNSHWDGMRVPKSVPDPNNPELLGPRIPTDDGVAEASGLEAELYYLPGERWELNFALGLLDTEYLEIGDPPANGTGIQPGTPFAYAPQTSFSLGVRYRLPLATGAELLFAGDYGWMDEYQRSSANQDQPKNPDGSNKPEPAYGLLNARIVFQPTSRSWQVALFGTNLTNEWYINGGFDAGPFFGYDVAMIGNPREIGASVRFAFD